MGLPVKTGSTLRFVPALTNSGTVSSTIAVPSDAEIIIVGVAGSGNGVANIFSGGGMTFTKGGTDTAMTAVSGGDGTSTQWQAGMFWLPLPDTGANKTLKWDWAGSAAPEEHLITITFWKGLSDTASPVRGSGGAQAASPPYTTGSITTLGGDLIVAHGGWWCSGESSASTWTNLTELEETTFDGSTDAAWATGTSFVSTTVSLAATSASNDGGLNAVSLKGSLDPGYLRGTLTGNGTSQVNPSPLSGSVASVAVGDVIHAVWTEQTALTVSGTPTDNLGNTYVWRNAGNDAGVVTARDAYSIVTTGGTLTAISTPATASADNYANFAQVIVGPISAIDANPANSTNDITAPFTCPSTGTLAQASEVILSFYACNAGSVYTATSPNLKSGQVSSSTLALAVLGYQTVAATTAVAPVFSGANPSASILGTVSFKLGSASDSITVTKADLAAAGKPVIVADIVAVAKASLAAAGKPIIVADVVAVAKASLALAGKAVAQVELGAVAKASLAVTGKPIVVADTVAVAKASLAVAGKPIVVADTVAVAKASLSLAGQTVTALDVQVMPVGAATLALAGKPLVVADTVAVAKASLTLTGQFVGTGGDEVLAVTAAALALAGKPIVVADTVAVAKASLSLAGKPIGELAAVAKASLTLAGKPLVVADTVAVAKASLALIGRTVTTLDANVVPVTPAALSLTGQPVFVRELNVVAKASLVLTGRTVTVEDTGVPPVVVPSEGLGAVGAWSGYYRTQQHLKRKKKEVEQTPLDVIETELAKTPITVYGNQLADAFPSMVKTEGPTLDEIAARMRAAIDEEEAIALLLSA